jgi:hypothetical protein
MMIARPQVERELGPKTFFNASVDSAKAEDMYVVWETAKSRGYHPSVVIIGVDLETFYDPAETDIRTLSNGTLRSHLPIDRQLAAFGTIGSTILSYAQIADSIRSVRIARAGYPKDKFEFDAKEGTFVWLERPPPVVPTEQSANLDGRFRAYRRLAPWRIAYFEKTLAELREIGARIYLYVPPMHPVLCEALRGNERYEDVRAKTLALMDAEKEKGGVIAVRDFTDIASFDGLADDFSDPLHVNEENAARIVHALLGSH